ncbi:hypothetical protein [Streptomyces sp. NPDC051214]|uniref:hypothetical protein n=1 Tax=Streptomyces sp. NPDC051214 TaxID=3155282 RepID=UPI003430B044
MTDARHTTPRERALGSDVPAPATAPAAPPAPPAPGAPAAGSPATGTHAPGAHDPGSHDLGSPASGTHTPGTHTPSGDVGSALLPQEEHDKLGLRLQQALSTFVDSPRQAVEEADSLFDDAVRHLTETLTERRRVLRASWQNHDTEAHTEELRLALRQYREATERLLRI